MRIGDRVALDGVPGTRGRVVRILSATRVRVCWDVRPGVTRRTTDEPIEALRRGDPVWLDPSGRPCPTVPCPRCGRATPLYRQPGAALWGRRDWRPFQIERTPSWCGHPIATVRVPEGHGWWREVPVLQTEPLDPSLLRRLPRPRPIPTRETPHDDEGATTPRLCPTRR